MLNNNKLNIVNLKNGYFAFIFFVLYFCDFVSKLGSMNDNYFKYTSIVFKIILQLALLLFILCKKNIQSFKILKYLSLLFLFFLIGNLTLSNTDNIFFNVISNIKIFDWYIFIFIMYIGFYSLSFENQKEQFFNLLKFFELIFIINSLFILIGLITKFQIFSSYSIGSRFGYNGLLRNVTHASYIYMIFITYFYTKFKNSKNSKNLVLLVISVLFSLLIGTKALYLFNLLFFLYLIYYFNKLFFITSFLSIIITIFFNFQFLIDKILFEHFNILYQVYINKDLLTMLFSGRNESIYIHLIPFISQKWTFINVLFGGASFNLYRTEFEMIDFLWFFGVFGSLLYFYIWNKYVFKFIYILKHKLILFQLIITLLAGSYFSSVPVVTFLFVLIIYINNLENEKY